MAAGGWRRSRGRTAGHYGGHAVEAWCGFGEVIKVSREVVGWWALGLRVRVEWVGLIGHSAYYFSES